MSKRDTEEVIAEIIAHMDAVADRPCMNTECANRDGKCARLGCGGYTAE